jgi:hypothetical protein
MAPQPAVAQFPAIPLTGPQLVVVDTGVLYNDIVYRLRKNRQTVLKRTAATGPFGCLQLLTSTTRCTTASPGSRVEASSGRR